MSELKIARGLPGSGKSTYATVWVDEDPVNRVRVNRDDIRWELYGAWVLHPDSQGTTKQKEDKVTEVEHSRIERGLRQNKDVIVDNVNLNPRTFSTYSKIAARHNAEFTNIDFPVSVEEAIRRQGLRDRKVPAEVIKKMARNYLGPKGEFHLFPGTYPVKPFVAPASKRQAVLFDMDGTLADTRSISHYVQGKYRDFDSFHRTSLFVPANPQVEALARKVAANGFEVVITTARSEPYREVTQKWLDDNNIPYANIFMRPEADFRPDYVVKTEMLKKIRHHYDVLAAVDDNPQAINAWRENGIRVTEVPGFGDLLQSRQSVIEIDDVFKRGGCLRCGRPLKNGGVLGPDCAKIV